MNAFAAFAAGLVFGVGLLLSGMTDPSKIIGFLDLAGSWDPSLLFAMGGGVAVGAFAFRAVRKRAQAFLGGAMHLPQARDIDIRLVAGSLVFGVGWGLAGFCPGPALVSLAAGQEKAAIFFAAMLGGMLIHRAAERFIHEPRQRARHEA